MAEPAGVAAAGAGRVLISYAHDDPDHVAQVLAFCDFLRDNGVDALIDREVWDQPLYWPDWMSEQIRLGSYVLVIGSLQYRAAAEGSLPADQRKGVRWEARQLKDLFYADDAAARARILPVLLPGHTVEDLPDWLSPGSATHYRVDNFTIEGAEPLLRVLTGQPSYLKRPLGPPPVLPPPPRPVGGRPAPMGRPPVFAVPPLSGQEVSRPELMGGLVTGVTATGAGTVGMTTGLRGAGGFGKTTLARMLVHEPRVREEFPDGIVWVTLGEDATGPDLAARINDLVEVVSGTKPSLADPALAGAALGSALDDRRMLLVVDDVWSRTQLEPFHNGGANTVRLVTTRQLDVLPAAAAHVDVDAMSTREACQLLLAGLDGVSEHLVAGLRKATGNWPVLLALVNGAARADVARGAAADTVLLDLLEALTTEGPTALDVHNPERRSQAVKATLGASLSRLSPTDRDRYRELAVFPEDVEIPLAVLARYWNHTGGLTAVQTRRLCGILADLSLLAEYRLDSPPRLRLHDVIRAYLRALTGHRRAELDRAFVDAHRTLVSDDGGMGAWWTLPAEERHLWEWLPVHLWGAGLTDELTATLHHPGWLLGKLEHVGPAGLETDLALGRDDASLVLRRMVRQNAHVLGRLEPPGSLAATLLTRLPNDPVIAAIRDRLAASLPKTCLHAVMPMPDLPHPGLRRTLTGHTSFVSAVAIAPDGTWLATADNDGTVRIWDPGTGAQRHTLTGHTGPVNVVAIAPDGTWLATAGEDRMVRIWDPDTGAQRHTLTGHTGPVSAVAIAPDGSWLATAGYYGTVRTWDPATGMQHRTLTGRSGSADAMAIAPDGTWLATGCHDGTVRIWDPATGTPRHTLAGHTDSVNVVAIAPDGTWLATADYRTVRIWDPATGTPRRTLTGHTGLVNVVAIAPDGTWLATVSDDRTVRIWDPGTGEGHTLTGHIHFVKAVAIAPDATWLATAGLDRTVRIWDPGTGEGHTLTGHTDSVDEVAIAPDATWLATAGDDGTVRIWDPGTGEGHTLTGHTDLVKAMAIAPDGTWLATAGDDRTVRIWDPATGTERHTLTGHTGPVYAIAIAPDGTWLATAGDDRTVRIWDPATGTERRTLTGPTDSVYAVAIAPDGTWLATAGYYGRTRIWDLGAGTERHALTNQGGSLYVVAIAPDGTWLATAGYGTQIWDPGNGTKRHTLTGHTNYVKAMAMAPDGTWLATASYDGTVRIWDPATGTQRHVLTGHTGPVNAVAIASDGAWLATASDDGTVRIWDPDTGKGVVAVRVAGHLKRLAGQAATLAAAGTFGPYLLRLRRGEEHTP